MVILLCGNLPLGGHLATNDLYQLIHALALAGELFWMRSNHLNDHRYVLRDLKNSKIFEYLTAVNLGYPEYRSLPRGIERGPSGCGRFGLRWDCSGRTEEWPWPAPRQYRRIPADIYLVYTIFSNTLHTTYHSLHFLNSNVVQDHAANIFQLRAIGEDAVDGHLGGHSYVGDGLTIVFPLRNIQKPFGGTQVLKEIAHLKHIEYIANWYIHYPIAGLTNMAQACCSSGVCLSMSWA